MTSTAISSQGSSFSVNTAASGAAQPTWTKVANVKSYSGFDGTATEIDVTDLDSTAKEKRLGLQDNGSFSLDLNVNYSDPGQSAMLAARAAGTSKQFKLGLPDGSAKTFFAFVKSFPIAGGTDTVLTSTVALTITGDVTDVPAGS
ncbi:phage tail tube protein [Caballeronia sp. LZ001]|uniref:phage tail tube protein n=1 Tax=Caballeronia sp. LZ001 TaxID=3038553 RepID=UPI00286672F9|nr:phage tail tube protein [Caballeronia sp. LZ001]MDR5801202.1 phage tail tube protein [Caballeronia sp. LZ001]